MAAMASASVQGSRLFRRALEPAVEQSGDGRFGRAELARDLGQRPALQVMQLDRAALAFRKLRKSLGHLEQFFVPDRLLAGRRLVGGQQLLDARGRLVDRRFERPLAAKVTLARCQLPQHVGQVVAQDRPQPAGDRGGRSFRRRMLEQALMSLEQGLLNDPGQIDLVAQPGCNFQTGQQIQVGAEPLEIRGLERWLGRVL